ncbi:MAG: ATP-dependent 6-phosphofructokinase [Dehalococcoidia bacterium]|nr:ATP-dependent 6-phosphofructokinase [Dehalococcoidia bacterium]
MRKRIGIMTSGGDCPGLNAAIRAAGKVALTMGYEVIGVRDGWEGLLFRRTEILDGIKLSGIIDRGGTILGASRTSPFKVENGPQRVLDAVQEMGMEALIVLGGDGTLTATSKLCEMGLPVVAIPKTIDNDVAETDYSIGFQTAVQIATDALDRLRSTAASHHRVVILEVMGRNAGWIATYAGMGTGADAILIPEIPMDEARIEKLCQMLKERSSIGINYSIVVIAEGTKLGGEAIVVPGFDPERGTHTERLGGVGQVLAGIIERETHLGTRVSSLGYIQRGGTPVAYDRNLATVFGSKAMGLVKQGKFGQMTALKGDKIVGVPLSKVANRIRTVDLAVYRVAEKFFG